MTQLKICRICLARNVRMYSYNEYKLKQYYEEVMEQKVLDGLPLYFCYLCSALLNKLHMFKEKCHTGQKALNELLLNGLLTLSSVSKIDRKSKQLESPIEIMTSNTRVKTYNMRHKYRIEELKEDKNSDRTEDILVTENVKLDYDTDDSFGCDNDVKIVELEKAIEENYIEENDVEENDVKKPKLDDDSLCIEAKTVNTFVEELPIEMTSEVINIAKEKINNKGRKRKIATRRRRQRKKVEKNDRDDEDNDSDEKIIKNDWKESSDTVKEGQTKKRRPPNTRYLDPKHWLKVTLTDEEAMDTFKARAFEPKYLSATYKCEKCYKVFSKEEIRTRHMKTSHSESIGTHRCRFCSVIFKRKSRLTKHMTTHYCKFECLRCGIVFPLEDTAYCHNDVHSGILRKCEQCGLQFRHYSTYYTHLRVYHRSENVCMLCGASFVTPKGLQQHKNVKHINFDIKTLEGDESTYCETCDIKFKSLAAYKEHLGQSIKHANITPNDIDLENSAIGDLAPVILKESPHRPMQRRSQETTCFVCEKVFPNYYRYKTHHRAEHKDVPIPTGSTQMCEICGATIKSGSISIHMNIHTREKLYPCQICGMQFNYSSSLVRHQLTHTGEKPYKCPLCDKRFTQKGSMKLHHRTFHLKEPYPKRSRRKNGDSEGESSFADLKVGSW